MPITNDSTSTFRSIVRAFDEAGAAWGDDLQTAKRVVEEEAHGLEGFMGVGFGHALPDLAKEPIVNQAVVLWLRPGASLASVPTIIRIKGGASRAPRAVQVRVVRAEPGKALQELMNRHPERREALAAARRLLQTGRLPYLWEPIDGEATARYGAAPRYGATPRITPPRSV